MTPEDVVAAYQTLRRIDAMIADLTTDLTATQWVVLAQLAEQPASGAMTGNIARSLHVTPAVVTGMIDLLERGGYVRREADAEDRRVVRVVITKSGLHMHHAITNAIRELS